MPKSGRKALLASIASTIADYRRGEIPKPDVDHVGTWIEQFDASVRDGLLVELDYVLKKTYFSESDVERFLGSVAGTTKLASADPCSFWRGANFLRIQSAGNSQRDMLAMFEGVLEKRCGLSLVDCGSDDGPYIYLDDAVFSGNKIRNDFLGWIQKSAPQTAKVHVLVIGLHRGGQWYAGTAIQEGAKAAGRKVDVTWWRSLEIEDRKRYIANSDVLRPASIPNDAEVQAYVQTLKYQPTLRGGNSLGENNFFSSDGGRHLLEQEFLKTGVHIRSICPYLNRYQRPLGNMVLETLGFGSLLITFRNCPNNSPLALWAGDPWYPLFPRKTN